MQVFALTRPNISSNSLLILTLNITSSIIKLCYAQLYFACICPNSMNTENSKQQQPEQQHRKKERKTFTITNCNASHFVFSVKHFFFFNFFLGNKISVKQWTPVVGYVEVHIVNYKCHNIIIIHFDCFSHIFVHLPLQPTHTKWQWTEMKKKKKKEKNTENLPTNQHTKNNITLNYSKIINNKNVYVKVVIYLWLQIYPSRLQRSSA